METITGAGWRRSSYSGGNGSSNCVEVARNLPGFVSVRDSKNPDGPALPIARQAWRAFTDQVKAGAHDLP